MKSEKIAELQASLAARGVKYCIGAYVDIHGVQKAKVVPLSHLEHMAHGSERYTGYALDGLGQVPNDDELTSVPDLNLNHIIQLPWEPKIAWMPADNEFQGKPYPLNTRAALKNMIAQANEMGFGFNLGVECEIFLLRHNEDSPRRFQHGPKAQFPIDRCQLIAGSFFPDFRTPSAPETLQESGMSG